MFVCADVSRRYQFLSQAPDLGTVQGDSNITSLLSSPMDLRALQLTVAEKGWSPYVVLGFAETLGYIVRGVTGEVSSS